MDPTEPELIAAVLRGDSGSFEPIVRKYQARVFSIARKYARHESEVEDIVQESFLKAYQKLSSYRSEAPFEHWLTRITVHTCYDQLRRHRKNREWNLADLTEDETTWLETFAREEAALVDGVAAARTLLDKVLEQLPARDRLVITLLELEERSVREIAALLGWTESRVKVCAFRARARMRRILMTISREKYL